MSDLPSRWEYYLGKSENTERSSPEVVDNNNSEDDCKAKLATLTLLEPCCGSGHFLREAFDMLADMYLEQCPSLEASKIADLILSHHLHGINIDPRAIQLTSLTLYLRAWEFVRDATPRQYRHIITTYQPPFMNIVAAPRPLEAGALQRHLRRRPQDAILAPLLQGIFDALERPDVIGSLLRPTERLNEAIRKLRRPHTIPMDFNSEDAQLRRMIMELAAEDPHTLKRQLLNRIAQSYSKESEVDEEDGSLFWSEAENGIRLVQLLDGEYHIVATNPPYMGSGNMDAPLKRYVEQHYRPGKRDMYAAFILRCLELCSPGGRVAMITQQSWMFLRSFAELRGGTDGVLRVCTVEALAHLGTAAFEEISGEVVQNAMFVLSNNRPDPEHRIAAFRLVGLRGPSEKARVLREAAIMKGEEVR